MKIETKFNIGDKRFIMHINRVVEIEIEEIHIKCISVYKDNYSPKIQNLIFYQGYYNRANQDLFNMIEEDFEKITFATKEELLKSL